MYSLEYKDSSRAALTQGDRSRARGWPDKLNERPDKHIRCIHSNTNRTKIFSGGSIRSRRSVVSARCTSRTATGAERLIEQRARRGEMTGAPLASDQRLTAPRSCSIASNVTSTSRVYPIQFGSAVAGIAV